jgi:hypothetical protein
VDITVHTKYGGATEGLDALHRVVKLIEELRLIPGMDITVTGEVFVNAAYASPVTVPEPYAEPVAPMGDAPDS